MLVATTRNILVVSALLAATAPAQVWTEFGDASSFPEGPAQVTRGETLDTISGSTGPGDLRDAYCIRIVEPDRFLATTDPVTWPTASADFDSRLFLFRPDGAPVLANDDTPPGLPPNLSTLTGVATDGSGFVLSQPGDYVLVVGGSPEDPEDAAAVDLFDIDSALDGVHAPDPMAGRFDHWEGVAPATGSYDVFLAGVTPCQHRLDAVFANASSTQPNPVCLGNGLGDFNCSDVSSDTSQTRGVALGFVNGDPYLDAVFANTGTPSRVCLGKGQGGFTCRNVSSHSNNGHVALGFVDGDQNLDAVFASNWLCLGNGQGGFTCSNINTDPGSDVALGFVDGDRNLDAVFAGDDARNRICLGDGLGGFTCSDVSTDSNNTREVALGFVDGDPYLDAVFANRSQDNRVCLGDGQGGFTCNLVGSRVSQGVALGFVDGDSYLDAIFANGLAPFARACLGDGQGGFTCNEVSDIRSPTIGVALGFVDGDQHLDAVFASNTGAPNRVCLGNGQGDFSCSDAGTDSMTYTAALGEVNSPLRPFCFTFDNLCDGIEITSVLSDRLVVGVWRNINCAGATAPMLGGYSGKNVSPALSWLAADQGADLATWSFNLNVDARTFDLWVHDTDFSLTQMQDDEPYTVTPGACLFGPEKERLPASTGVSGK